MQTLTSDSVELAVMRVLCKRFKTVFSASVLKCLKESDQKSLVDLDIVPGSYTDAPLFARDYLLYSLLRKWKGAQTGIDTRKAAISSWISAEQQCFETNERLKYWCDLPSWALPLISRVQRKINHVLGNDVPFEKLRHLCRWSTGATYDLRRSGGTDASIKMSHSLTYTLRAKPHLYAVLDDYWVENCPAFIPVRGNRAVNVAKNAKTDRMIAAEPTANSFLQQGVGRFIRGRLKAFGIDLDDQSVNQDLAYLARSCKLATIDLSMASDTLSRSVVELLLPVTWVDYLNDLRSETSELDGKIYHLNKFSSMGNAFTFELESLIFWAISSAICEDTSHHEVKVYGDDIIVPAHKARDVVAALIYFGFKVNSDKSFLEGDFYESCGKHYHTDLDVTPVYQKEPVVTLQEYIRFYNRLDRWGSRHGRDLVKDALDLILSRVRLKFPRLKTLPRVPPMVSDDGFISHDEFESDINGDYRCLVLRYQHDPLYGFRREEIFGAFAYKLRVGSSYSNVCPDGHFGVAGRERYVLKWARVWRSQCD